MSRKKTENGRIRAIGIDLGTTNSAVAEITWDPAVGAVGDMDRARVLGEPARVPGLQIRTLEIEQPTREGVYTSPLVRSVVAVLPLKLMIFVGIARATQWVYLSTVKGTEFDEMAALMEAWDRF